MSPLACVQQTRVLSASVEFVERAFATPLTISSGTIRTITEAQVRVEVEAGLRRGIGRGSIYLSDLWAWPDASRTHEQRDKILRDHCVYVARELPSWCHDSAHPLEHGLRIHHLATTHPLLPPLAGALCGSPFDAAIHDAVGHALGMSAFDFFQEDFPTSTDALFPEAGAASAIRNLIRVPPATQLAGWFILNVGNDPQASVAGALEQGFSRVKLKLSGKNAAEDAHYTAEVYRAFVARGVAEPLISVDSNEGHADSTDVLAYLTALQSVDPEAFEAVTYLEQPTARDITVHAFNWRPVTELKPVLLDEGLTSLDLLPTAKDQGWSGLALKTCKGHSFALCAAAWAFQNGMVLSMQDLTNPGLAAIHSWLFAAHVPTINGIELNSPQFTPDANIDWLPRLDGLFAPLDGFHRLPNPAPIGLGSLL